MTHARTFLLGIGVVFFTMHYGYTQQISEKEISLQEKLIDASRERILGNYEKAIAIYQDILKEDERTPVAAYELARLFDTQGDNEQSLRYIKIAIAQEASNIWYKRFLADVYQKMGKNLEAASLYEELVKQEPKNEYYYYRWAYFLVRANDIPKALKVYDELERKIGVNEELSRRKHSLYAGMGNNKKAAEELERLIATYPSNIDYRHMLASFLEQLGESQLAKNVYKKILEVAPADAKARMALAGTPKGESDVLQYLQSLQPIFENTGINIDLKIGKLLPFITKVADTGDKELATAVLALTQILEKIHPQEAKGFAASGDLLYYSGNAKAALLKYQKALEKDDSVFLVWEQVMRILGELRDYASLRKITEEAMDLFPNKAIVFYLNGVAYDELNQKEQALESLEQAAIMAGRDGKLLFDIQLRRGCIYSALKKNTESSEAFEEALKLNAKSAEALNKYSYALALSGENLDKASIMARQANELSPNRADFQATYGWVYYKMKAYEDAKNWLSKALNNGGEQKPDILEHYGDVLFQLNDADGALQYWIKAQEKGSVSELLDKKIADRRLYE